VIVDLPIPEFLYRSISSGSSPAPVFSLPPVLIAGAYIRSAYSSSVIVDSSDAASLGSGRIQVRSLHHVQVRSQALEASLYTDMLAYIHSIVRTCMCAASGSLFVDSAVVCTCTAFVIVNLPMPGFLYCSIAPRSGIVDSPAPVFAMALVL
jgi:hypothetical protein